MNGRGLAAFLIGTLLVSWAVPHASALTIFKKTFDEAYVKESGDETFKAAFKKNTCNVCHVKGKKRDFVNAYGMELAKLIPDNAKRRIAAAKDESGEAKDEEEERILKELKTALKKVEGIKLPTGETYGDILKAHQLPFGEAAGSIAAEEE